MKKLLFSVIILTLLPNLYILSQNQKLTIEDAVIGQWTSLYPENLSQLQWIPDSDVYMFAKKDKFIKGNLKKSNTEILLSLEELNNLVNLNEQGKLKRIPKIQWLNGSSFKFNHNNTQYIINPFIKNLINSVSIPDNASNLDFSKSNKHFAFTIKNNLYIKSLNGITTQITDERNKEIVYGQEVHRREFGIHKGTFWSPRGKKLAFYRKNESMVSDYPLVDVTQRIAGLQNIKYPMAGMKSHQVKVGVYDLNSEEIIYLETGKPLDKFLTNVAWGPEEKFIYIAELNRAQNHMKLNQYDANTGEFVKTLFEEKHEKYVEPSYPIQFVPNNNDHFIWLSRRDGYNHLYLYDTDGKLIKQLTKGEWEIMPSLIQFDKKGEKIFFISTKESPIERHLYSVDLQHSNVQKITNQAGFHNPQVNTKGTFVIDNFSNVEVPRMINILDEQGKRIKSLLEADNPLAQYNLSDAKISKTKTADEKTDLYYRLIKPADFDPAKKYPAIIYVYGGPHAQLVQNRWLGGARMWQYYMAQKGYVMLTLDNRGSTARGLEFENIIHRQLGKHELSDQMQGVDILKNLGYVDTTRIGVHGWSYGGFMTTSMMLKKPKTFKVGVAGGPVIDWRYYEVMYGERYMDKPQENPEGYEEANLNNYVTNLEGDLLIINGYLDDVVVPQHSLSFLRQSIKKDVQIDYFTYPKHKHNVRGRDRIHLMEKVTEYFEENL